MEKRATEVKETVKTSVEETSISSRKETKKAPEKKPAVKKTAEIKTTLCVQYLGKEVFEKELIARVKKAWTSKKNKVSDIRTIDMYVKPEDNAVYYVINGDFSGSIEI